MKFIMLLQNTLLKPSRNSIALFLLFVFCLIQHSLFEFYGDDEKYMHVLDNQNLLAFIITDYHQWSSRFIINSLIILFSKCNIWVWRVVDSLIYVLLAYLTNLLFGKKEVMPYVLIGGFMLFPMFLLDGAGWIATSVTYIWPMAFGMLSFVPFFVSREKFCSQMYSLLIPAFIACNNEQMCCVVLVFAIMLTLYKYYKKDLSSYSYAVALIVISFFFMVFILTCPGNHARTAYETARWFPSFPELSVFYKLSLGLLSTYIKLYSLDLIFVFFMISIVLSSLIKRRSIYISYALLIIVLISNIYMVFYSGNSMFSLITGYSLITPVVDSYSYYILIVLSLLSSLGVSWCLYAIFDGRPLPVLLYLAGLSSRLIMSFSPTLFASGYRTMSIFYMSLVLIIILLYHEIISKTENRIVRIFYYLSLTIAVFANTTIFFFLFWYIPLSRG